MPWGIHRCHFIHCVCVCKCVCKCVFVFVFVFVIVCVNNRYLASDGMVTLQEAAAKVVSNANVVLHAVVQQRIILSRVRKNLEQNLVGRCFDLWHSRVRRSVGGRGMRAGGNARHRQLLHV
jgi:hypothetical protein